MIRRTLATGHAPPSVSSPPCARDDSIAGYVYCAAREVQRLAHVATSAADADHLLCVLANLECIARSAGSPSQDVAEIEAWRVEAEERLQSLRAEHASVHISARIVEKRRVSA